MSNEPQLIIDLDLDTFVYPPVESGSDSHERAPSAKHKPSPRALVEFFYEEQLELKRASRTKGAIFDFHEQSYHWWRRLIFNGQLKLPFDVVHVDAHDDLLSGFEIAYFFEEWTSTLDRTNSLPLKLNSANYLGYAAANGWLRSLTWVRRSDTKTEPVSWIFKDFSLALGILELKTFPKGGVAAAANLLLAGQTPNNFSAIGEVPFVQVPFGRYKIPRPADFIFVARSPSFTPAESDANEDLIRERVELLSE